MYVVAVDTSYGVCQFGKVSDLLLALLGGFEVNILPTSLSRYIGAIWTLAKSIFRDMLNVR